MKDIEILYKGDIYELACLILKLYDASRCGYNAQSRHTVYGLAGEYAMLLRWSRQRLLAMLAPHNLPLEARSKYDAGAVAVEPCRKLIGRDFEKKIQATLARVWGEDVVPAAEA